MTEYLTDSNFCPFLCVNYEYNICLFSLFAVKASYGTVTWWNLDGVVTQSHNQIESGLIFIFLKPDNVVELVKLFPFSSPSPSVLKPCCFPFSLFAWVHFCVSFHLNPFIFSYLLLLWRNMEHLPFLIPLSHNRVPVNQTTRYHWNSTSKHPHTRCVPLFSLSRHLWKKKKSLHPPPWCL